MLETYPLGPESIVVSGGVESDDVTEIVEVRNKLPPLHAIFLHVLIVHVPLMFSVWESLLTVPLVTLR